MVETINQSDWDGVYYDNTVGEFYMINVRDNDVVLINPFVGDEVETLGFDEFRDLANEGSFEGVSDTVLRNPSETVENLLMESTNAISGDSSGFRDYRPVDVDFAITATNLSTDNDAPYFETLK